MTAQPALESPSHARHRLGVLAVAFCSGAAPIAIEVLGTRIIGPVFGIGLVGAIYAISTAGSFHHG